MRNFGPRAKEHVAGRYVTISGGRKTEGRKGKKEGGRYRAKRRKICSRLIGHLLWEEGERDGLLGVLGRDVDMKVETGYVVMKEEMCNRGKGSLVVRK